MLKASGHQHDAKVDGKILKDSSVVTTTEILMTTKTKGDCVKG